MIGMQDAPPARPSRRFVSDTRAPNATGDTRLKPRLAAVWRRWASVSAERGSNGDSSMTSGSNGRARGLEQNGAQPRSVPGPAVATAESSPPASPRPATPDSGPAPAEYESFCQAVASGKVTFHQVARAWFQSRERFNPCAEDRLRYQDVFPKLLDAFGGARGGIVTAYFCENIRVAAALTSIRVAAELTEGPRAADVVTEDGDTAGSAGALPGAPRGSAVSDGRTRWRREGERDIASSSAIHLEPAFGDPESWKAKAVLFRCLELHYRALEFLKPKPRKIAMRMAFNVIAALLGSLDARAGRGESAATFGDDPKEIAAVEEELARAERYYVRAAQRTAQVEYFLGMLGGLLVLLVGAAILGVVLPVIEGLDVPLPPLLVSLFSGGCGGVVSVMSRMSGGKLVLNHESGKGIVRLLGGMRPLIGAVFGAALYVLFEGGLLSLAPQGNGSDPVYFYAGVAFLAGFSERFAEDAIASVGRGFGGVDHGYAVEAAPEAPSAEPAPREGGRGSAGTPDRAPARESRRWVPGGLGRLKPSRGSFEPRVDS